MVWDVLLTPFVTVIVRLAGADAVIVTLPGACRSPGPCCCRWLRSPCLSWTIADRQLKRKLAAVAVAKDAARREADFTKRTLRGR